MSSLGELRGRRRLHRVSNERAKTTQQLAICQEEMLTNLHARQRDPKSGIRAVANALVEGASQERPLSRAVRATADELDAIITSADREMLIRRLASGLLLENRSSRCQAERTRPATRPLVKQSRAQRDGPRSAIDDVSEKDGKAERSDSQPAQPSARSFDDHERAQQDSQRYFRWWLARPVAPEPDEDEGEQISTRRNLLPTLIFLALLAAVGLTSYRLTLATSSDFDDSRRITVQTSMAISAPSPKMQDRVALGETPESQSGDSRNSTARVLAKERSGQPLDIPGVTSESTPPAPSSGPPSTTIDETPPQMLVRATPNAPALSALMQVPKALRQITSGSISHEVMDRVNLGSALFGLGFTPEEFGSDKTAFDKREGFAIEDVSVQSLTNYAVAAETALQTERAEGTPSNQVASSILKADIPGGHASDKVIDVLPVGLGGHLKSSLSDAKMHELIGRAEVYLQRGDALAARLTFAYLARLGSALAAEKLARSYDPWLATLSGDKDVTSDRSAALVWYQRAADLGSSQAATRLRAIKKMMN